ncbi:related to UTP23 - essential nucleolar protein that is a component of the SSU processome [Ustilago trichophora]|uniref:U three protein 23 n=1 Tax=Ustilago trichophora TaxID=86804 RepID=A0A5C3ECY3_9BASI|nr:related to UTP23 - essential nucleolar protein that is a component of the SSU processome [Ustilago trichophora]
MRQRRAKIYRKMLHQYQMQFGFREPYQLLLDDTFSLALSRYKISDPLNQFSNVLQSKKIKPLITQCCMAALYALGKEHQSTVDMAKAWERRMCNHREAIDPQECVKQCVGAENKHRYIVASEQGELRRDLRLGVAGLPMMHFTQAVMVLEPMSPLTKSKIEEKEETKLQLPASEAGLLKNQPSVEVDIIGGSGEGDADGADKVEGESAATVAAAKEGEAEGGRRRKRKAPNPLSVRKAKNPRLTMEEKLKREQEFKKQKQRAAARARMEASKINSTATPKDGDAAGADGEGPKKRRRRAGSKKSATPDATAVATEKKDQIEQADGGA